MVVEHDEEIMLAADGNHRHRPGRGRLGGEVVYQGDMESALAKKRGHSLIYR